MGLGTKVRSGPKADALPGAVGDDPEGGWNQDERVALQTKIAERQPFLDFVISRVDADGTPQKFRVSGEPMFDPTCRYIGYRGVGVELAPGA